MSGFTRDEFELGLLIVEALEGEIAPAQFARLEQRIQSDPEAARQYLEQVMNSALLMWRAESWYAETMLSPSPEDAHFLAEMGEYEKTAPAVEIVPEEKPAPLEPKAAVRSRKQTSRFSLIAAAGALAAMLILLLYLELHPVGAEEPAARITDSLRAVWEPQRGQEREPDGLLQAGSGPLVLKEGYVRLVYEDGAQVLVEGPARFEVKGAEELGLSYGQVYVYCPASAIGFAVAAPTMRVIDLGTEFGVKVSGLGGAEVHMVKGKASLIAGGAKGAARLSTILTEGAAKRVEPDARMQDIRLQEHLFARQISSQAGLVWRGQRVDLADAVGGGTGFGGGRAGLGWGVETGRVVSLQEGRMEKSRSAAFVKTAEHPWIDGVFVPGRSAAGGGIISSTGLQFEEAVFGSGAGFGGVYNVYVEQNRPEEYFRMVQQDGPSAGIQPAIGFYGSGGITFDLDALRRAVPGCRLRAFRAVCAVAADETVRAGIYGNTLADFVVLADGRAVYEGRALSRFSQPALLEIPIQPRQRFLTLAVMDSGDSLGADWAVFVQPSLELTMED
ncbi:MAG TPA: NPCBM/NEW2 domain-containing protein [Anaerohalosphaeraceae bacterium]|nr:NPCBM/NEW2 domain-containing protein [Anaerohalosphaeraceae bacterium]